MLNITLFSQTLWNVIGDEFEYSLISVAKKLTESRIFGCQGYFRVKLFCKTIWRKWGYLVVMAAEWLRFWTLKHLNLVPQSIELFCYKFWGYLAFLYIKAQIIPQCHVRHEIFYFVIDFHMHIYILKSLYLDPDILLQNFYAVSYQLI